MNKIFLFTVLFIILISTPVSADASGSGVMTSGEIQPGTDTPGRVNEYNFSYIDAALKSGSELEILKAVLVCIRDIDICIHFFIIIVFGGFIVWLTVIHPLSQFLK